MVQNYRFFKRFQIVDKSKREFLDEFSEREVVMLKKIFIQLKSDLLSKINTIKDQKYFQGSY